MDTGERMALVEQAIEDFVADNERLPSTTDIIDEVQGLGNRPVREALDKLEGNGRIVAAYRAPKNPTIYVPAYMFQALLNHQKQPDWIDDYGLQQRKRLQDEIHEQQDQVDRLRRIEALLYASGNPLEDAIRTALEFLEVPDLEADYEDPEMWDFTFTLGDRRYIGEAKGKSRAADKKDVGQLQQWMQKYSDENPNSDPAEYCGLIIVNHYREHDPVERWPENEDRPPLTGKGVNYLKLMHCGRFMTTLDLFRAAKRVIEGDTSREEAREELAESLRTEC